MQTDNKKFELFTSVEELIRDTRIGKPHVVILGAGASLQAFPKGDKNGRKLPLMFNFIETLGLDSEFERYGLRYKNANFEDIYSNLYENRDYRELVEFINSTVYSYFSNLELPSQPTLYDHLVLSLREKDLIATFNWDPFLYYACWRNHKRAKLPHVAYLHGNVAVGYCLKDNTMGWIGSRCSKCGKNFTPSRLLYPIKQKGYSQEPFIKNEWEILKRALGSAYVLTIFGYGAPKSDVEAIEIMKSAWGDKNKRNIEQIAFIDTRGEKELVKTWEDFIHTHHYDKVTKDFYRSSIGLFPRRTCEAEWNYTMPKKPVFYPHNPIPRDLGFKELWEWYTPLIEAENKKTQT